MLITCDGHAYDTEQMHQFRTGDPDLPMIFMTADRAHVLLCVPAYCGGLRAVLASQRAIHLAAIGYRLPSLLIPPNSSRGSSYSRI